MRRPIVNNSARGNAVYEPFCGSGTTLIAAVTVGRVCLAMELEPAWCDVIVERWQGFTGKLATRLWPPPDQPVLRTGIGRSPADEFVDC